jgi:hypothetical protein
MIKGVNRLSSKTIGELAMPNFCPRCFWIRIKLGNRVPFRTPPPGIFSSIDSYTKRYFERLVDSGKLGEFVAELSNASHIIKKRIPDFKHEYSGGTVFLTGVPDAIFGNKESSYTIVDYKTARFTDAQRSLLPLYEVQVRAYATMAKAAGLKPLSSLLLIYLEPLTGDEDIVEVMDDKAPPSGKLNLKLQPFVHSISQNESQVIRLLETADRILNLADPPDSYEGCLNCSALKNLKELVND